MKLTECFQQSEERHLFIFNNFNNTHNRAWAQWKARCGKKDGFPFFHDTLSGKVSFHEILEIEWIPFRKTAGGFP